GFACRLLDRCDEALRHYRAALKLRTQVPVALYNLGNLLRVMVRYQEAQQTLEQALLQRPGYADAQRHLVLVMATLDVMAVLGGGEEAGKGTRKRGKNVKRAEARAAH